MVISQADMRLLKVAFPGGAELFFLGGPDMMVCLKRTPGGRFEEVGPDLLKRMVPEYALKANEHQGLHFSQVLHSCLAR